MNDPVAMELNELNEMLKTYLIEAPLFNKNLKDNKDLEVLINNWHINHHRDYDGTPKCKQEWVDNISSHFENIKSELDTSVWDLYLLYKSKLSVSKGFSDPTS
ncbi:hypothetical protein [Psychromonas arctica]|uniref:hypothetical protein n=1 Tax=Psychromonas arctica TaxID=168275 RepID=UPI002FD794E1